MMVRPSQAYHQLKQHIVLENKVFAARGEATLQALTLTCASCFTAVESKSQVVELMRNLGQTCRTQAMPESLSLDCSLCYFLGHSTDIVVPRHIREFVDVSCIRAIHNNLLPYSFRGMVAYFLYEAGYRPKNLLKYMGTLTDAALGELEVGNYAAAIDGLFATYNNIESQHVETLARAVRNDVPAFGREKIAKLVIELMRWQYPQVEEFLVMLEDLVLKDFECWIVPDIQFALIESEKLINSNLPNDVIRDIFDTLKKSKEGWTAVIDSFQEDGVVVDLRTFSRLPSFSPTEDVFSLLALIDGNYTRKHELNSAEGRIYVRLAAAEKAGKLASLRGGQLALWSSFIIGTLLCLSGRYMLSNMQIAVQTIRDLALTPASIGEWALMVTHPLIMVTLLVVWQIRIHVSYRSKRDLKPSDILTCTPLLGKLVKCIKGDDE